jgi:N4-gp56 family major capsid protein
VNLTEYGNATESTAALRGQSFLSIDEDLANLIGYNAANSLDKVVADIIYADSTNVKYVGQTERGALTTSDNLTSNSVREAVATLRGASVPTWSGGSYVGFVHPDVVYDFIGQTGTADLRSFQIRQDGDGVRSGEIGTFDGVRFISTPRALLVTDGGSSTNDAYGTLIMGQQALAKAYSTMFGPDPTVEFGPVVDRLRRFQPIGWYAMCGYGVFRGEALYRIETTSTIGANS